MWQWLANSNHGHVRTSLSCGSGWQIPTLVTWGHLYHMAVAGQFQPWSREDIYITWQWLANLNQGHVRTSISWGSGWLIENHGHVRTSISWASGWQIQTMVTWGHLYIMWQWLANSNPGHVMTSISCGSGWTIPTQVTWGHLYHVVVAGQFKPRSRDDIYIPWQWLANFNPGHVRTSLSCGSGWPIQIPLVVWGPLYHVAVSGQFKPGSSEDIYITWQWLVNQTLVTWWRLSYPCDVRPPFTP